VIATGGFAVASQRTTPLAHGDGRSSRSTAMRKTSPAVLRIAVCPRASA
jgi:hypothetical protein